MSTLEQTHPVRAALPSHGPISDVLPALHRAVPSRDINGAVDPLDGAAIARLVGVLQLLRLKIISHECVRHHAVHEQHERRGRAVYEGAQASHHHHDLVLPGGKTELQQRNWQTIKVFVLGSTNEV